MSPEDAIVWLIDNPSVREDADPHVEDLMKFVKGPDFPTAGMVCDQSPGCDWSSEPPAADGPRCSDETLREPL